MYQENEAIARRYIEELWNNKNFDVIDEVFTEDFVGHLFKSSKGHNGIRENVAAFQQAFPDAHTTIHDIFGSNDRIVIRWSLVASHQGEFFGIPATGGKISLKGITIERFESGKIAELWAEIDVFGLIKQLKQATQSAQAST
ncbi:MAG: ester cyclase [Verrucomicrobiota bacterium]